MSAKSPNILQDTFLNHLRKNHSAVTVFLVNGVKLQGSIAWFDSFSILLRRGAHSQLVYKHAVSTVMPTMSVQMADFMDGAAEDAGGAEEPAAHTDPSEPNPAP